ncbi:pre-rRNA processing protein-like protein Utp22 [Calycina marina]|uniref:U3 small nucleolar RNA-associated protein 22 n=1 Tax=Calycina marina TaxID=1763456 RepID=A0A9P7ZC75_9HELO|nr:pre-rRNA processing protein-like protein Utp22 [Calycina marina]
MTPLSPKRRKLECDSYVSVKDQATMEKDAPEGKLAQPKASSTQTTDENALYAAGQYKSSIFKLQVDELLAELRPNYGKRTASINQSLHKLNSLIEGIQDRAALPVAEATKLLQKTHKIIVPFPDPIPSKDVAYKLAYAKPTKTNIVGSYALKTMVKSEGSLTIDMIVVMPNSIFQEKDFLNYRYFYKRAYYIACVAAGLQDFTAKEFKLSFEFLNGNTLHPILVVEDRTNKNDFNFEIRIIPAAHKELFAEAKLRPTKNSIRPKSEEADKEAMLLQSPFYNASIKSDCNAEAYLQVLHSASKQAAGYTDSCMLGRIWLQQRGFSGSVADGGFGNFEWACLTALLMKGGGPKGRSVLSPGYSSYQLFKAVVQFLATSNLINKPVVYEKTDITIEKSKVPIFYDGPRGQNILYKMTTWSYESLRQEARTAVDMLNESSFDQFEAVFILRTAQPLQRYDSLAKISIPEILKKPDSSDHSMPVTGFSNKVFEVLREGLMDRVKLINVEMPSLAGWPVKSSCPTIPKEAFIQVGVIFDPANIDRLVDHGPSAEEKKKSAKFQKFWGEKAELRRFKDGSILESLVWTQGSTYSVYQGILSYLIERHFTAEVSNSMIFIGEGFEKILPGSSTAAKVFDALKQSFNELERNIRSMELTLQLRQLSPISPQLRSSSVDLPLFNEGRPLQQPADVLIQFEGSGRWPDDLAAIQRTKIAFLLKIGGLLREANETTSARVGLENTESQFLNCGYLDVVYRTGAAFRIRIHHDREQVLLERQIKDKFIDYRTREDAVSALSEYNRICIQLPFLSQAISTHCTRFPLLSSTIRLVKQWFARHMLSNHVAEELIELLVMRAFLLPYPWRAPSSTMSGFLRTILLLSRWDWRSVPLVVDFTGTMTKKEVEGISTRLEAWRKIDPGMNRTVLFAGSNQDPTGTAFTGRGPSKLVASRITALARSACNLVKNQGVDLNPKSLFFSSTSEYDFVIHLAPAVAGLKETKKSQFKNLEVQLVASESEDLVGYHPHQSYLEELENLYSDTIVFFHGTGALIGGLWNPQHVAARPFKVNLPFTTKPVAHNDEEVQLDKTAILAEISRIGGEMVSRIAT